MKALDDICYVVSTIETQDELNMPVIEEISNFCYCKVKSIRQSEFYQAQQVGIRPELQLEIRTIDLYHSAFENELICDEDITYILYNNKKYEIIRTYKKNSDFTEVVCKAK